MGNCFKKTFKCSQVFKFNLNLEKEYDSELQITDPVKNKKTKNLISDNKKIPIIKGYRVDQIYPDELVKIFSLLEYDYDRINNRLYNRLTQMILLNQDNCNITISIEISHYQYLQKLNEYIKKLKDSNDLNEFKKRLKNKQYVLNHFYIYYLGERYRFYYPYFDKID